MTKKSLLIAVLTGFFLLVSCIARQDLAIRQNLQNLNLKKALNIWMHVDHSKLIAKLGAPDESYETERMGCKIGLVYRDYNDIIIVDTLFPNMPAKKMGIRVDDVITHINDISIKTMTESEIETAIIGGNPLLTIRMEGKNSEVSTKVKVPCIPKKMKMKFLIYGRSCIITFKINHVGAIVGWFYNNC